MPYKDKTVESEMKKIYYKANKERISERKKVFYQKHKKELREKTRQYARSDVGRENNNRAVRKYYSINKEKIIRRGKLLNSNNPEKYTARYTISSAIKLGKIIRPEICQSCGKTGRIEAHHSDYSKIFNVDWLCTKCHGKEHRKRG